MKRNHWFKYICGISENEWDFTLPRPRAPLRLSDYGQFTTPSIHELEGRFKVTRGAKSEAKGAKYEADVIRPLVVRFRDLATEKNEPYFDTSALQYSGPAHAMYQVASNFNCIELGNARANPFNGKYLTELMSDKTQGPNASAGAALGAILRIVKHKQHPINLLASTPLQPRNGKLERQLVEATAAASLNYEDISIGLHTDTRAIFNRSWLYGDKCLYNAAGPLIDQVFTSTVIGPHPVSEVLLRAAYEGTYLAAIERQSKQLVLTLVGGGVFNNEPVLIMGAIINAHSKYSQYLPSACQVVLPLYTLKDRSSLPLLKELPLHVEQY